MCMQVNKYWRDWLDHTPENFKSLTSVGRIVIPPTSLYRWISPKKSSVAALISITIRLPSNQNIDHLRMLEKAASLRSAHFIIETHDWPATDYLPSQLEELRISGSGSISDAILSRVLSKLRSLTYADFGFVDFSATMPVGPPLSPKLETMIFGARTAGTLAPNFQTFIRQFPNMKRFSIAGFNLEGAPNLQQLDFREWRKLTELSLDYCLLKRFPLQFPSQLEVLSLYNTKMCNFNYALATSINDYYTNNLKLCERGSKGYFPRLKRLNLHGSDFQAFYYVYSFAGLRNGSLTDLYIGDTSRCAEEDDPYLENWPQLLPHPSVKLEVLSIDTVYVSENVIRQCLRRYPRLKVIILSETKATGSVIRDLMRRRQPPIFIDVRNTLMANDARVYATSNGAAVYHDQCRRNFYVRPIRESNELSDESKEWLLDWYRRILPPPAS